MFWLLKAKREKKNFFLRNQTWNCLLLNQCTIPPDNMSRTPKEEINFRIYKLLRVSNYLASMALRF